MKEIIYVREGTKMEKTQTSFSVGYCRLTIIDASGKITAKNADELFIAFKKSNLEEALEKIKNKYKKYQVETIHSAENFATVKISVR